MLLISDEQIHRLLPMQDCIEVMDRALRALARGKTILPLRTIIPLPENRGAFASMPAVLMEPDTFGLKAITVFPANEGTDWDSHQGVVLLFESEHGGPVAILDASSITGLRTAAVSAVATRALANQQAEVLALIGSGVQAGTHLDAMLAVRSFKTIRVYSRHHENARRFAREQSARRYLNIEAVESAEAAVRAADVICTLTSSRQPVVMGEWLKPGAHVNAVGASQRTARELDSEAVRKGRLYADRRESMLNEAGDFLVPKGEGVIDDAHIVGEIGEVLEGLKPGRASAAEITIFKSLGLAIEDVAAAQHIYDKAKDDPSIPSVELGGRRR